MKQTLPKGLKTKHVIEVDTLAFVDKSNRVHIWCYCLEVTVQWANILMSYLYMVVHIKFTEMFVGYVQNKNICGQRTRCDITAFTIYIRHEE